MNKARVIKRGLALAGVVGFVIAALAASQIWSIVILTNGSMAPTYPEWSVCFVERDGDFQKGDVIAFYDSMGQEVTHRLIGYEDDGSLITQGDGNDASDDHREPLRDENVIGPVRAGLPLYILAAGLAAAACFVAAIVYFRRAFRTHVAIRRLTSNNPA